MKSGAKVTRDHTKDLAKTLKAIAAERVLVGVPLSTADRKPDPDDPEPISNAAIGRIMEFGSPAANIPARPHLVPAVDAQKGAITKRYRDAAKMALNGNVEALKIAHTVVGQETSDAVRLRIETGPFAALAPMTIADRKRRGIDSEQPLIRTGQYRTAITFVIRKAS